MTSYDGPQGVGQLAIPVGDLQRSLGFYRDVLGLRFLFQVPPELAFLDCGGVRLMLDHPEKPEFDHASSILYFAVPDIQAAHAAMKAKGARFEDDPHLVARLPDHDLWMTFFRDTEDNVLALMSEVKR